MKGSSLTLLAASASSVLAGDVITNTITKTKTVCPCEAATQATHSPGEVYVTTYTTETVTTCPGEAEIKTFTYGEWTSIYTQSKLSTITDTITKTITAPSYPESSPVGPGGGSPSGYPGGHGNKGHKGHGGHGHPGSYPSSAPAGPGGYPGGWSSATVGSSVAAVSSGAVYGSSASASETCTEEISSSVGAVSSAVYSSSLAVYESSSAALASSSGYASGSSVGEVSSSAVVGASSSSYASGSSVGAASSSAGASSSGWTSGSAVAAVSSSLTVYGSSSAAASGSSIGAASVSSSAVVGVSSSGYASGSSVGAASSSALASASGWSSSSAPYPVSSSSGYSVLASGTGHYPSSSILATGTGYYSSSSILATGTGFSYPSSALGTGTGYYSSSSAYATGTGSHPSKPTGTQGCIPCEHQPSKSAPWCGYTIHDNWYDVMPKTCVTREYWWALEETTIQPDGVPRVAMTINGTMPGPMIEANWGDTIIVHLTNNLPTTNYNGTSLHFHGIRQNRTNEMDGVSSITQCPIAPGHSMTYKWEASSYGTSWWHSHYSLQTYDGMFGPIVIHGPASDVYDDEQVVILQDWNHIPVDTLYGPSELVTSPSSGPQTLDTSLINGLNVWGDGGSRFEMTVEEGKSYRLRLVNTAIQSTFVFYVDGHELEVIAMDFVPIVPYNTTTVTINIGQRYDLILRANQAPADYWMRSDNQQPCGQLKVSNETWGIVHYSTGPQGTPSSQPYGYAPTCLDEPYESLVPIVPWSAGAAGDTINETTVIAPDGGSPNLYKWTLSGTTFFSEWDQPTLKQVYEDGSYPDTSGNLAIPIPDLGEWVYVIIESPIPLPHPIHLHGHDFLILAQGTGPYTSAVSLNLLTPPRRDVAVMPADPTNDLAGYLVLAFFTSNPGVWLLHCHIGWHNAMGFALQIIENLEGIQDTIKYGGQIEDTCSAWVDYANSYQIVTSDSGV